MAKGKKTRKGGGGKLSRSEIVQVRLDPKLKFAAELAAKIQRRSLSSFIEWCVAENSLGIGIDPKGKETVHDIVNMVWSPSEITRFLHLAKSRPHLLTFEEEKQFELIKRLYKQWVTEIDMVEKRKITFDLEFMDLSFLNAFYGAIKEVVNGNLEENTLVCMMERAKEKSDKRFFYPSCPEDEIDFKKHGFTIKQLDQLLEDYGYQI